MDAHFSRPGNRFQIIGVSRHRHAGTATVTVHSTLPGAVELRGRAVRGVVRRRRVDPEIAKLPVIPRGSRMRRLLAHQHHAKVHVAITNQPFSDTPRTRRLTIWLIKRGHSGGTIHANAARPFQAVTRW